VRYFEQAGIADRLDRPGHPRSPLGLHVLAPQSAKALDESARRLDLQILPFENRRLPANAPVSGARRPVRSDDRAEIVFAPHFRIGDRLPQPLGRRLDVDFEYLFHFSVLQFLFQIAQGGGPGRGVFAHPAVVDEPDRDGVEEMQLLPPAPPGRD
jgi:hypothetical protein